MSKVMYIIPVHEKSPYLTRATLSVMSQSNINWKCIICCNINIKDFVELSIADSKEYFIINAIDATTYQELVNDGIRLTKAEHSDVDYISLLEVDDELVQNATEVFIGYSKVYDAQIYAPLAAHIDCVMSDGVEEKKFLTFMNEAGWAPGLSEDIGYTDFGMMLRMNFLFLNGLYIHKDVFDSIGMLKVAMKYQFDYEWNLRAVYNGIKIFNIPKISRYHYLNKTGALNTFVQLPDDEKEYWITAARKEYFFEADNPRYNNKDVLTYVATGAK